MNKLRRKQIDEIQDKLAVLREMIDEVLTDEQEALDNLPEGLQESERGEAMQQAIDALEDALNNCDEIDSYLEDAKAS